MNWKKVVRDMVELAGVVAELDVDGSTGILESIHVCLWTRC